MTAAMPEPDAVLPAGLADLDGPQLIRVRTMIDALIEAGRKIDPEASASLSRDSEAVTMTLTASAPLEEARK